MAAFSGRPALTDPLLTCRCGFTPHGVDYEVFKAASEIEQNGAQWISDGAYGESRAPTMTQGFAS